MCLRTLSIICNSRDGSGVHPLVRHSDDGIPKLLRPCEVVVDECCVIHLSCRPWLRLGLSFLARRAFGVAPLAPTLVVVANIVRPHQFQTERHDRSTPA